MCAATFTCCNISYPPAPGSPWLLLTARTAAWNPAAPARLDVAAFLHACGDPATRPTAVALYTGDLLPDLDEEAVTAERARLRALYLQVIVPSPIPPGNTSLLRGVAAVGPDEAWAVGYTDHPGNTRTTLTLHYGPPCPTATPSPPPAPSHTPTPGGPTPTPASCAVRFTDVPASYPFYALYPVDGLPGLSSAATPAAGRASRATAPTTPTSAPARLSRAASCSRWWSTRRAGRSSSPPTPTFADVPPSQPLLRLHRDGGGPRHHQRLRLRRAGRAVRPPTTGPTSGPTRQHHPRPAERR